MGPSIPLPQGLGLRTSCRKEGGVQQILRGTGVIVIDFGSVCVSSLLSFFFLFLFLFFNFF